MLRKAAWNLAKGLSIAVWAGALHAAPAKIDAAPKPAAISPAPFDAQGYRTARFRAPVDRDPAPATRIALSDALALSPFQALFIDVVPVDAGVRETPSGEWRLSEPHETIPGAQWHPETGRSPVDPALWQGLVDAVSKARQAQSSLPVIVFCRTDCWMSWNAARRLALAGVVGVRWLAEGTDGWHAAGRPLAAATPVVIPDKP